MLSHMISQKTTKMKCEVLRERTERNRYAKWHPYWRNTQHGARIGRASPRHGPLRSWGFVLPGQYVLTPVGVGHVDSHSTAREMCVGRSARRSREASIRSADARRPSHRAHEATCSHAAATNRERERESHHSPCPVCQSCGAPMHRLKIRRRWPISGPCRPCHMALPRSLMPASRQRPRPPGLSTPSQGHPACQG